MTETHSEHSSASWYIYMLRCSDSSLYTGVTTDPRRRVHEHNSTTRGARYTRSRRPVTLVYLEKVRDRAEACRREHLLKQLNRNQKEILLQPFILLPEDE